MNHFLVRWLVTTAAVFLAAHVIPGIYCDSLGALICASLLLGIINALIRPVVLLLSLPFIVVTLGFFILIVNALMLEFVSFLVAGFHVSGFWSAFFGSIMIGIVSWVLNGFFKGEDGKPHIITHREQVKQAKGRVIDI